MRSQYYWPLIILFLAGLAGCSGHRPANDLQSAIAAEKSGDTDAAVADFSRAIASAPNDQVRAGEYVARAGAYVKERQFDQAITDCTKAISLKPDFALAYSCRAVSYLKKGQFDLAIADFDIAIRLAPNNPVAFEGRGSAYLAKHEFDRAISDFNTAMLQKTDNWSAYTGRGAAFLYKGDIDRAIADEDQAIKLNPKAVNAYRMRGLAYDAKFDLDKAIADFSESIRLAPDAGGYIDRGITEVQAGQLDAATSDLTRGADLSPTNVMAIVWLHIARSKTGTDDKADLDNRVAQINQTVFLSQILAVYRQQFDPHRLLDTVAQGNTKTMNGFRCEADFHVGEYYVLQHDSAAAKPLLRKAVAICPIATSEKIMANVELKKLK